jgi:hypothetical protein
LATQDRVRIFTKIKKIKVMKNFRNMIIETIESNQEELKSPSRNYDQGELIYMRGYTNALKDLLSDYDNELMDNLTKISLN